MDDISKFQLEQKSKLKVIDGPGFRCDQKFLNIKKKIYQDGVETRMYISIAYFPGRYKTDNPEILKQVLDYVEESNKYSNDIQNYLYQVHSHLFSIIEPEYFITVCNYFKENEPLYYGTEYYSNNIIVSNEKNYPITDYLNYLLNNTEK